MGNRLMDAFSVKPEERNERKEEKKAVVNEVFVAPEPEEATGERVGRPTFRDKNKVTRTTTLKIYSEDFVYCKLRMKELGKNQQSVSGFIAWLLEKDKQKHPELASKARKIDELEK